MTDPTPTKLSEILEGLFDIADSVYIPNDTKDYTGVKITVDVNRLSRLMSKKATESQIEILEHILPTGSWTEKDINANIASLKRSL